MRPWLTALSLLVALPASLPAAAAPFAMRLGVERIVLDAPPGFTDTTDLSSPRLQELAETLTSASNRILVFALTDADVRRFMAGDQIEARRYMIAVTPRVMERERVNAETFNAFVTDSLRELGKPADAGEAANYAKYLDRQPHGKVSLLAELRKDPAVASVLQGTRLPTQGGGWQDKPPQYVFSTTTIFLVRGKLLRLDVFSGIDVQADVNWLRGITERWMSELLRLNSR